jgi:hypothetical protein
MSGRLTPYKNNVISSSQPPKSFDKTIILDKDLTSDPKAIGILSDYKDQTDPKYIGPGTWNVIHRHAFNARLPEQQNSFIVLMKEICHGFPCITCRGHCAEYIKNHPMEEYLNVSVDINGDKIALGLFVWTWKFHNTVNTRIKNPMMSWDTAYNLYSEVESLVCSKNCLNANEPPDGLEYSNNHNIPAKYSIISSINIVPKIPEFKVPTYPSQPFRMISTNRR